MIRQTPGEGVALLLVNRPEDGRKGPAMNIQSIDIYWVKLPLAFVDARVKMKVVPASPAGG